MPAPAPLADRIAHTDPAKYRQLQSVHGGAGPMSFMALIDARSGTGSIDTNFLFLHRGVIPPKSGIGAHFHNQCEEMFVILDGEAQFTVDGRTSVLKGPAGAPARMGHSHAIYNASDRPLQWLNINVSARKGEYDNFDLGDPRVGVAIDPIPVFMSMRLDRALLQPMSAAGGKGAAQYRRALAPPVFAGPWAYVDHLLLPPGAATASRALHEIGEVYYVMDGAGRVSVGAETAAIAKGDAVAIGLDESKSFENTGSGPLELLVVGVASDAARKFEIVPPPRPAGRGGRRRER